MIKTYDPYYGCSYTQTFSSKKSTSSKSKITKPSGYVEPLKEDHTYSVSLGGSCISFLQAGGTASAAINFGTNDGINARITAGSSSGTPFSSSYGISFGTTDLGSVDYLAGLGKNWGGSAAPPRCLVSIGYDYSTNFNFGYSGHSASFGPPGEPEAHLDFKDTIINFKLK